MGSEQKEYKYLAHKETSKEKFARQHRDDNILGRLSVINLYITAKSLHITSGKKEGRGRGGGGGGEDLSQSLFAHECIWRKSSSVSDFCASIQDWNESQQCVSWMISLQTFGSQTWLTVRISGQFYKMSVFWLHPRPMTLESLWVGLGCWWGFQEVISSGDDKALKVKLKRLL